MTDRHIVFKMVYKYKSISKFEMLESHSKTNKLQCSVFRKLVHQNLLGTKSVSLASHMVVPSHVQSFL